MNDRHRKKLCLTCLSIHGTNWSKHEKTEKHLNNVKVLGGTDPGFKYVRDLNQESVPLKKLKNRKVVHRSLHKNHKLKCRTCGKVLQRERSFKQHLRNFHSSVFNDDDKIKEELKLVKNGEDETHLNFKLHCK